MFGRQGQHSKFRVSAILPGRVKLGLSVHNSRDEADRAVARYSKSKKYKSAGFEVHEFDPTKRSRELRGD
jgi:hypothetical protein